MPTGLITMLSSIFTVASHILWFGKGVSDDPFISSSVMRATIRGPVFHITVGAEIKSAQIISTSSRRARTAWTMKPKRQAVRVQVGNFTRGTLMLDAYSQLITSRELSGVDRVT